MTMTRIESKADLSTHNLWVRYSTNPVEIQHSQCWCDRIIRSMRKGGPCTPCALNTRISEVDASEMFVVQAPEGECFHETTDRATAQAVARSYAREGTEVEVRQFTSNAGGEAGREIFRADLEADEIPQDLEGELLTPRQLAAWGQ